MFATNVRQWERVLRLGLGITMLLLGWLWLEGTWALPLRVFAVCPLITGVAGWSPLYALLGIGSKNH